MGNFFDLTEEWLALTNQLKLAEQAGDKEAKGQTTVLLKQMIGKLINAKPSLHDRYDRVASELLDRLQYANSASDASVRSSRWNERWDCEEKEAVLVARGRKDFRLTLLQHGAFSSKYLASGANQRFLLSAFIDPSVLFTPWFAAYETYQGDVAARLARINDSTVQILETFVHENRYYQIVEFIEGDELGSVLERCRLEHEQAFALAQAFVRSLAKVHSVQVIHADLTPWNLIVPLSKDKHQVVKITVFECAILEDKPKYPWDGGPRGTPFYMSPEHLSGRSITDKSDVYTAALIVSEILTGVNPLKRACGQRSFTPEELSAFLTPIQTGGKLPKLSQLSTNASISPHLDELFVRCWSPDETQRPSADAFLKALEYDRR